MKLKFLITTEIEIDLKDYPGAKTLKDAAKMQQEWLADGTTGIEDIINERMLDIIVLPIGDKHAK